MVGNRCIPHAKEDGTGGRLNGIDFSEADPLLASLPNGSAIVVDNSGGTLERTTFTNADRIERISRSDLRAGCSVRSRLDPLLSAVLGNAGRLGDANRVGRR